MTQTTKHAIELPTFDSDGFRAGSRYVQLCDYNADAATVWDDANGCELCVDGTTMLAGWGQLDGECVRLVGPGGWYLCVSVSRWASFGFAAVAE